MISYIEITPIKFWKLNIYDTIFIILRQGKFQIMTCKKFPCCTLLELKWLSDSSNVFFTIMKYNSHTKQLLKLAKWWFFIWPFFKNCNLTFPSHITWGVHKILYIIAFGKLKCMEISQYLLSLMYHSLTIQSSMPNETLIWILIHRAPGILLKV